MTSSRTSREFAYRSARTLYGVFKKLLGPAVRSRPRLHHFVLAQKKAFKELLRPPLMVLETPLQPSPASRPAPEPEAAYNPMPRSCLPGWLVDEWRRVHELEPGLFPNPNIEFHIITDFIRPSLVGRHYLELCALYGEKTTHVLLVPWLKSGGADLVALNYVAALTAQEMAGRVVVISTENADSPWAEKLPAGAQFIEFGKRYPHLSPEEQERLLTRLFLQFPPRVIHNINSLLGYNIFIKYGKAITETSRLYACAFCEDITPEGRSVGYPVCFLPQCFDSLTAVLSDNQYILDKLRDIFAFGQDKLFVHYQPMTVDAARFGSRDASGKESLDILWASRLDIQKRPDVLIKVAEKCKAMPFIFHVYGSPVYGTSEHEVKHFIDSLNALPNVKYYGPFDGLPSLPTERFDLFLYTSQWDGLPNVLLEAVSLGLPVIASSTGGIPELIQHDKTGFVISPYDNIEAYVDTLRKIHADRSVLKDIAAGALDLLESRHSWGRFVEELRKVPFYVSDTGGKKIRKYKSSKELKSENSIYKTLGITDVDGFYAEKFVCQPPPNVLEYDPASKFDITYFKQYWIFNNVAEGSCVLDIGCGSGTLNLLKSKKVHLVGTDLSEKALERALLAGYDEAVMCDSFDIPFPDKHFDYIVSLDVLGHIENEIKNGYLDEWVRLLKDDGVMLHGIECADLDYSRLDETAREYVLIDGHVGLESFDKIEARFRQFFDEVAAENFSGPCHNWYDIRKYETTENLIGKDFRDFLMTFNPDQVRGFNSAMLLMRNLLLKEDLLGKSGGFMFIKAGRKKRNRGSSAIQP